ncbi:RNA-directed DNA polymerase [Gregarina niphandrodes]|uniref:RNA-directed DNA polymerase n=1 Tax=Gregarina niphandrodes TaxID=110365 RepID=A0A023AV98_GRENI|nr:RNA-directed DNA polymerase [Gregarina niphandrodes]EZG42709.1 RNA-directed DNA polymerase [Gregarina niphandrodes]|eukprot:XP_011134757.1 RNA-directed DNA polymerase [Gregarina niphandrodes]
MLQQVMNQVSKDILVNQQLEGVLLSFKDLWVGDDLGRTKLVQHAINLEVNKPIASRCRRYSEEQKLIIEKEVREMLPKDVIRESQNYRPLNKITTKDEFPIPRIDDLLRAVKGSRYFIALDLRAGYWQVTMKADDIPKTAFRTPSGLYEFTVVPFGLVNAPTTFQRLVTHVFGDLFWEGVLVYLDDILIHASTLPRIMELLQEVFKRLRFAGLKLRLSKCTFLPSQI